MSLKTEIVIQTKRSEIPPPNYAAAKQRIPWKLRINKNHFLAPPPAPSPQNPINNHFSQF